MVREDIRTTPYSTTDYPDVTDFMNAEEVFPETIHTFLDQVIQKHKKSEKEQLKNEMYIHCPCNNCCNSSRDSTFWVAWK